MAEVSEANISRRTRELFDKGLVAMERDNLPYAMDMFMAVLETEPRFLKCRKFLRASAVKHMNQTKGAGVSHIMTTLAGLPQMISARMAIRSGDAIRALGIAEKLMRTDPLNMQFVRLLCSAAQKAGMPEVAIHTLNFVREYYQQDVALLRDLGALYMAADQPEEARKCFEAIVALRPNDGVALQALKNAMARETMVKGGWDESAKDGSYRKVIKDIKQAEVIEADNKAVRDEANTEMLIRDTEKKLKLEPENVNYRRALARLYVQVSRFDDAIRILEEAKRATGSTDPQLDQAMTEIKLMQFDEDIKQCRQNGDMAGAAAREKERQSFHFSNVQVRVERYPNDLALRFEYGQLLYENGQYNEAIQQFQMSQRNPKLHTQSLYFLGLCFMQKSQYDMAREQLEKAAEELTVMNDLKKEVYYQLGTLLEKTGKFEEAANRYFKDIYQNDISFKDVAAKIEKSYRK
ncbi:MAG: tetratricopeptide repeat protein [Kiritimatiellia bacterium]